MYNRVCGGHLCSDCGLGVTLDIDAEKVELLVELRLRYPRRLVEF